MSDTARQRFAKAMRGLNEDTYANDTDNASLLMRQAVEAFADVECDNSPLRHDPATYPHVDHAACRASLRKECGL